MKVTIQPQSRKLFKIVATNVQATKVESPVANRITATINRDGLSAYHIAVKNGYVGTEKEYAADLTDDGTDFMAHYILNKT